MKQRIRRLWLGAALLALLLTTVLPVVAAGPAAISWQVWSGGGAPAAGGAGAGARVALDGSLGQPVAGTLSSSGGTTLSGGFWTAPNAPAPLDRRRLLLPVIQR